jgi:hypothetical protein
MGKLNYRRHVVLAWAIDGCRQSASSPPYPRTPVSIIWPEDRQAQNRSGLNGAERNRTQLLAHPAIRPVIVPMSTGNRIQPMTIFTAVLHVSKSTNWSLCVWLPHHYSSLRCVCLFCSYFSLHIFPCMCERLAVRIIVPSCLCLSVYSSLFCVCMSGCIKTKNKLRGF